MIVKIWPINADFSEQKGKPGGWQGVRNAQNYIEDREKVAVPEEDLLDFGLQGSDVGSNSFINTEKDFHRVIDYVKNEDKTEAKYVSKYMCECDDITKDFRLTAERIAYESHGKTKTNTGAMAFHIVQSFPPDLNISNEEVHQCGIELVQRLEKYQAVICSHVHPVVDKDGNVHGRSPHNHILINAFMHPDFYDPEKGGPRKYHACKETYRQLQIYNDEIAIEHGLPIIRSSDQDRMYSWHESNEKNKGTSWKERVRVDIEKYRCTAKNWNEFVKIMKLEGYEVSEKAHVTYTTPDGNKVRDCNLGDHFTKNSLELYWSVRRHNTERIKKDLEANEELLLSDYVCHFGGPLSVKIPLGNDSTREKSHYFLPLNKDTRKEDDYLNLLSDTCAHAKLHRLQPIDHIELCDTVVLVDKKLVFCHVKEGFDTKMRVLTAQVRSSAKILTDLRVGNRLEDLRTKWQTNLRSIANLPPFDIVEKAILGTDGYSIAECIVFSPDHDISTSVTWSNSVIAKYELSALIKGWEYEFPLEIAIPKPPTQD